jgi:hypothetical protein
MWMTGMRVGLDLVWIAEAERVISVVTEAWPCDEADRARCSSLPRTPHPPRWNSQAGRAAALAIAPGLFLAPIGR